MTRANMPSPVTVRTVLHAVSQHRWALAWLAAMAAADGKFSEGKRELRAYCIRSHPGVKKVILPRRQRLH